jgi:TupA-like ATPgrasp
MPSLKKRIRESLPDSYFIVRNYRRTHGVLPNVISPQTFNEKVLHRILFDRRTILTELEDKLAARSYVESRLGPGILPKLYYLTDRPETIPFDKLPERFVVKPTHGSGWVQMVTDKSAADQAQLIDTCYQWLNRSFYQESRVWVYKHIEPCIMVEELIDDGSGPAPNDYKVFVFGGKVEMLQVDTTRFTDHRRRFYTPCWEKLDVLLTYDDICGEVARPPHLPEMIIAAETLGKDLDFIRIDFYDTSTGLYFGEFTTGPGGGWESFQPKAFDHDLGGRWILQAGLASRILSRRKPPADRPGRRWTLRSSENSRLQPKGRASDT